MPSPTSPPQPAIPQPDRIDPQAPPEAPVQQPPEVQPVSPDYDNPAPALPEAPPLPTPSAPDEF